MTRVLHLVNGLRIGGKERVALELCRAGREEGHDDRLALFEHRRTTGPDEFDPGGVPVHEEPLGRGSVTRTRALVRTLRQLRPDVVHAHGDSGLFLAGLAATLVRGPRIRRVCTLHSLPATDLWRDRCSVRSLARRFDAVVCVSEDLRRRRVEAGWLDDALVVPNGVDLDRFRPEGPVEDLRARLGLGAAGLVVGMVARFEAGKQQRDLLAACAQLRGKGADVGCVLVGDGPDRESTLEAAPHGLPVLALPAARDVPALLRGLDVAALTTEHEGMPMTLLEAMACARPVVASRVGGIPALLGDAPVGSLVEPGQVDSVAAALAGLMSQDTRRAAGAEARRHAESQLGLGACLRRYSKLYGTED